MSDAYKCDRCGNYEAAKFAPVYLDIEEWWAGRFDREESASPSTVEVTGKKSATVHFHPSWEHAIGDCSLQTDSERSGGAD